MPAARTPKTIDEYLATMPAPTRRALEDLRRTIKTAAPKATEKISYQIPTFEYKGGLVSFAGFKAHCSLFAGRAVADEFAGELKGRLAGKSTIRFTVDDPLPKALVRRIVKMRVAENEARAKGRERARGRG